MKYHNPKSEEMEEILKDEIKRLDKENKELRTALHHTINRPLGVVPDSALKFYKPE